MHRIGIFLMGLAAIAASTAARADCGNVPAPVAAYLKSNPDWTLVTALSDPRDRESWKHYNGDACPGIAAGNFFGGMAKAYAVAVVRGDAESMVEKVVVIRSAAREAVVLVAPENIVGRGGPFFKVVTTVPAGRFEDRINGRKIKTDRDAIVYTVWEAYSALYYHRRGRFESITISN
jgi:hypothetical protein